MEENHEKNLSSETIANVTMIGAFTSFAASGFLLHTAAGWAVIGFSLVFIAKSMIEDRTTEDV